MLKKFSLLSVCAAIFALCLVLAGPAWAGSHDTRSDRRADNADDAQSRRQARRGKSKPKKAQPKPQPRPTVTEDNDGDGRDNQGRDADGNGPYPNESRHPSGKDRYDEPGGSGNQGKSQSDPDGMENGGADKPGGSGGVDQFDQDGNNGCGNDQDFEDDNNGWCGKPKDDDDEVEGSVGVRSCPETGSMVPVNEDCDIETPEIVEVDENSATPDLEEVLGVRFSRAPQAAAPTAATRVLPAALGRRVAVAGAVLPFTGGELLLFVVAALALIAAGAAAVVLRRSES